MADILTTAVHRKRIAEREFMYAAYCRPEIALEDYRHLEADGFIDEQVKSFWAHLKNTRDSIGSAVAVSWNLMADLAAQPGLYMTEAFSLFGQRLVEANWFYEIARLLPKLAQAIEAGDVEAAHTLAKDIGGQVPGSSERIPPIVDIGLEFVTSLDDQDSAIKTYIPPLDRAIAGLWRSNLSILCARPSVGKTALALQIARNATASGKVLFFSLEMSARELWARIVCGSQRVNLRDVLAGKLAGQAQQELIHANADMIDAYNDKLLIDDQPVTTSDIWRKVAFVRPELVIVDHLRLLGDKNTNEVQRLGQVSWELKKLAKEYDIAVLALAQLNRQLESRQDKHPELSDLRASGEIEENADLVLGLHRDRIYLETPKEKTPADLTTLKFRNGIANTLIRLEFDGVAQWFDGRDR